MVILPKIFLPQTEIKSTLLTSQVVSQTSNKRLITLDLLYSNIPWIIRLATRKRKSVRETFPSIPAMSGSQWHFWQSYNIHVVLVPNFVHYEIPNRQQVFQQCDRPLRLLHQFCYELFTVRTVSALGSSAVSSWTCTVTSDNRTGK